MCQHYYTLETSLPPGAFGFNDFKVSCAFPPSVLVLLVLSTFLAECVTGQERHLTLVTSYWMDSPW